MVLNGKWRMGPEERTGIQRQRVVFVICCEMMDITGLCSNGANELHIKSQCTYSHMFTWQHKYEPFKIHLISGIIRKTQLYFLRAFRAGCPEKFVLAWLNTTVTNLHSVYLCLSGHLRLFCNQEGKPKTLRVGYNLLLMTRGIAF